MRLRRSRIGSLIGPGGCTYGVARTAWRTNATTGARIMERYAASESARMPRWPKRKPHPGVDEYGRATGKTATMKWRLFNSAAVALRVVAVALLLSIPVASAILWA